jgi:hypothetical protein
MTIFGRGIQPLLPLLDKGSEGIKELMEEAKALGVVLGPEEIANAKEYALNVHKFEASLTGLKYAIGGPVLGALVKFQRWMGKIAEGFAEWRKQHPEFFTKTLRFIGAALVAFGVLNAGVIASTIASWALMAAAAVADAIVIAAAWVVAEAPMLALVAAAVLLGLVLEDLYGFLTGKKSVIGDWVDDIHKAGGAWQWLLNVLRSFETWFLNSVFHKGVAEGLHRFVDSAADLYGNVAYAPHVSSPAVAATGYVQSGTTRGGMPTYLPANSVNANITVNAAPGMSEQQVAQQVVDQLDKITREAQAAAQ